MLVLPLGPNLFSIEIVLLLPMQIILDNYSSRVDTMVVEMKSMQRLLVRLLMHHRELKMDLSKLLSKEMVLSRLSVDKNQTNYNF